MQFVTKSSLPEKASFHNVLQHHQILHPHVLHHTLPTRIHFSFLKASHVHTIQAYELKNAFHHFHQPTKTLTSSLKRIFT